MNRSTLLLLLVVCASVGTVMAQLVVTTNNSRKHVFNNKNLTLFYFDIRAFLFKGQLASLLQMLFKKLTID
jgi:hypothetical protein